jgi:hypothetical protein
MCYTSLQGLFYPEHRDKKFPYAIDKLTPDYSTSFAKRE